MNAELRILYTPFFSTETSASVPLDREIPISSNFSIADVRNPEKRNASFTKTVSIPGTQIANTVFEHCFMINQYSLQFNPNLKTKCFYYVGGIEVFRGDLQLKKINVNPIPGFITYECNIIGVQGNLFLDLGDEKLEDLDFSAYDHTLNQTNIAASWTNTSGLGYTYPLIDYGLNGLNATSFNVNHLKPAFSVYEYVKKIIEGAGYTYTSTFLTSAFVKRLLIPCVDEYITLSSTQINNNQFYAGRSSTQSFSHNISTGTFSPVYDAVIFNDDSSVPFNDAGGVYNTATGEFTVGTPGWYGISAPITAEFTLTPPSGTTTFSVSQVTKIVLEKYNGSVWVTETQDFMSGLSGVFTSSTPVTRTDFVTSPSMFWTTGQKFRIRLYTYVTSKTFNGAPVGNGTLAIDVKVGSTFYAIMTDTKIIEGNTLTVNNTLPKDKKKKDFILDLVQIFNLYFDVDKTNPKNLIIEPRDDGFYTGTYEDWTKKLDLSQKREILPMAELDGKTYFYKYKSDKDYWNERYENTYKEAYGSERYDVTNDFIKSEKKTEVGFSATPLVGNNINDMVIPAIYKVDGGTTKPMKANIRLLYYGGLKTISGSWTLKYSAGQTAYTQVPFAGHVDDPQAPTLDLCWDNPQELYYNFAAAQYTNNNLWNKYYSKFMTEITDKDSKILKAYFRLNEVDISVFSFRKYVFINDDTGGSYYIVNKIQDYNPLVSKTTIVELLKLKAADVFVPETIDSFGVGGTSSDQYTLKFSAPNFSYDENTTVGYARVMGTSNINHSSDSNIIGNNNRVGSEATNVTIIGTNNRVYSTDGTAPDDIVAIGNTDRDFSEADNSKVFLRDSVEVSDTLIENMVPQKVTEVKYTTETKTGNFTTAAGITLYYIDATGGNITATLRAASDATDTPVDFIRTDASGNTVTVTDGSFSFTILTTRGGKYISDGSTWYRQF